MLNGISCGSKVIVGLQVTNIQLENKAHLIHLAWEVAYGKMTWSELMRIQFLKSKYQKYMLLKLSSI